MGNAGGDTTAAQEDWEGAIVAAPATKDLREWIRDTVASLATSQLAVTVCYDGKPEQSARYPFAVIDWITFEQWQSDSEKGGYRVHVQVSVYGRPDDKDTVDDALDAIDIGLKNWQELHATNGWKMETSRLMLRQMIDVDAQTCQGFVEAELWAKEMT